MEKLGEWLRAAREEKGLSLEDVERETRIRVRSLAALERGDYAALSGGEPQVRGFLRRYAAFLGLSPEEVISRYEREVYGEVREPSPALAVSPAKAFPFRGVDIAPRRTGVLPILVGVGLLLLLGLVGWWFSSRSTGLLSPADTPIPPTASAPASPQASASPVGPPPTPTFPVAASGGVTLTLEPLEHVWVRVTTDGLTAFEGMLAPGNPQTWTAKELIAVETGNGGGVVAVVNGQDLGPLGERGQICVRGWGPQGEVDLPAGSLEGAGGTP